MEIKVFQNAAFGTIRTMQDEKGEPLFCAKDATDPASCGVRLAPDSAAPTALEVWEMRKTTIE